MRCFYCGATKNLIDSEYPDATGWGYPIKACKNQKECIEREKAIKMGEKQNVAWSNKSKVKRGCNDKILEEIIERRQDNRIQNKKGRVGARPGGETCLNE